MAFQGRRQPSGLRPSNRKMGLPAAQSQDGSPAALGRTGDVLRVRPTALEGHRTVLYSPMSRLIVGSIALAHMP